MKKLCLAVLCATTCLSVAKAGPIDVTFTTSGSNGDWTYDFTFINNIPADHFAYFLGVDDVDGAISGNPAAFGNYGGYFVAGNYYNLNWLNYDYLDTIAPASSMSGFTVHDTAWNQKASFGFFAFTYAGGVPYPGAFDDGRIDNPAFVGVASGSPLAAPEPSSWAMMVGGFGLVGGAVRRRKAAVRFA